MEKPLRILHLEDSPEDCELAHATLLRDGLACELIRVETEAEFNGGLEDKDIDLILSDVSLPAFNGIRAQEIWSRRRPEVPFVFLSGTFGEHVAIERLRAGATDYVLKHWMEKLPAVVRRALREAAERAERLKAEHQIRELNAVLERRVEERTAQLASVNEALGESERRLQDILDRSPAAIFLKDLDGRYVFANRRCEEILGRDRSEIVGKTDHDLLPPRLADMHRANDLHVMEVDAPMEFEEIGLGDGVGTRVFHANKFPLRDRQGVPYELCGISTDITERKHSEEALKIAKKEAERANRAKSEFLSRMSHDLRTPLNAVLGFAQLLEMDDLTADQRESVGQILQGGRHLLDMMNEVLDISRIESGHLSLSPEPVSVTEIIEDVVRLVRPLAAQRRIEILADPEDICNHYVQADRQRLNQILLNLVSNAIKYNREGGRVELTCHEVPGDRVRIKVTDTGTGIRREKLTLLFRPFERLGADQTAIEGTGLGLALSRGLAEAMGGTIGVESQVEHGTTFWVDLKAAVPTRTEAKRQARVERASAGETEITGTVLYVEDNLSNVRLVERLMRHRRPAVKLLNACNGAHGIAMTLEHKPDLILLDLHLPDTNGEDVLRRLWEDSRTREIPVAVLSADATLGQSRRLMAAGAAGYLTKPIEVEQLLALVDERLTK